MTKEKSNKRKPGPEAERLQIPGNWKDAVSHALKRGKPPAKRSAKKRRKGKR